MPSATPSEFDLIDRYFKRAASSAVMGAVMGIGDDAAIIAPSPGMQLLMSTDMLVADCHFYSDTEPEALGWKTLAVNVSDLAAMGATPRWALLALSLPAVDEAWIAAFARGFFACADAFGVELIGGDTTRGPMSFCVTILGEAPGRKALLRSGAKLGDDVWVSGQPGRAALGLAHLQGKCVLNDGVRDECLAALHRPQPRVPLGLALRGIASAAIDVSDGLLADLGHLLEASKLSADIPLDQLPQLVSNSGASDKQVRDSVLAGGDDYELVFTAPVACRSRIESLALTLPLALTRIGSLVSRRNKRIRLIDTLGQTVTTEYTGYDHFRG